MESFLAKKVKKILLVAGLVLASFVFKSDAAQAATLFFSPSSGNHAVGDILSTGIFVNTQEESINNSDAVINFPTDLLEVVSVSKSGSIFSLWVGEPAFSNSAGTISFNGGLPTPGFKGSAGKIIGVVFRLKEAGSASLVCSSAAVRANDGYGTDVLQACGQARFTLVTQEKTVPQPPAPPSIGTPAATAVTSFTHPDPARWYNNNDPKFTWVLPSGITGVNVLTDRDPTHDPGTRSDGKFSTYGYNDVDEGSWYFHIRLQNSAGWGAITHFRFNVDTAPPSQPTITLENETATTNPRPTVALNAVDSVSGVAYYEVAIDGNESIRVAASEFSDGKFWPLPTVKPGEHTLVVRAVDQAGNMSIPATATYSTLALEPPRIEKYTGFLTQGEAMEIGGSTYPNANVTLELRSDFGLTDLQQTQSDARGRFALSWPHRLRSGEYTLRAYVTDQLATQSEWSAGVSISVSAPAAFRLGKFVITYFAIFLILVGLLALLAFLLWLEKRRYHGENQRLLKEIREVEQTVHSTFDKLRENMRRQLKLIEKAKTVRQLTLEEEAIALRLKKDMDIAEKMIGREVEDVREVAVKLKRK